MAASHLDPWAHDLPAALGERTRRVGDVPAPAPGDAVIYWMRTAVRGHENPALDVALTLARRLEKPIFVYHALSERYPYASDRHHTFILEGARDVATELAARGIGYAFHLERPGHDGAHLHALAERAAVLVTEDFPASPLDAWTAAVAARAPCPVLAVDTACVVPMRLVPKRPDRAFRYRDATGPARAERVSRPYVEAPDPERAYVPDALPFEPVELAAADLPSLVASCRIDHGVGPVAHTRGGSRAGYARWRRFVDEGGLRRYARDRNDALRDGVSRISAYLHYGHVSPFRLAREVSGKTHKGADKYLDELMIWRELAYAWCFHEPRHATVDALPRWARETLAEHETDDRALLPTWETLARGRTGDALWDAAQRSLLTRGELHNNVRMTWGKAIVGWTKNADEALATLVDLNHRYALDGRDPGSYGGLQWCLGAFDRPFRPEVPVLGAVRPRPTREHAKRLDVAAYAARTTRAPYARRARVAVVGGGLAGLACARTLADHGLDVSVFDKGRGPGGRAATRRTDEGYAFDHGAQYFTVRDPRFGRFVRAWIADGHVARWRGRVAHVANGERTERPTGRTPRLVGVPGMSAVVRHLARDLDVTFDARVAALRGGPGAWHVELVARDGDTPPSDVGPFDWVVVACPAPQARSLVSSEAPALAARLGEVELAPCWAAMVAFDDDVDVPFDAATVDGGDGPGAGSALAWVARDASKPGRADRPTWVLHASPGWTRAHLEDDADDVAGALVEAFAALADAPLPRRRYQRAHRWRYARVERPLGEDALVDPGSGLAYAGDACLGGRVEHAYLSGVAAAGRVLGEENRTEVAEPRAPVEQDAGLFA